MVNINPLKDVIIDPFNCLVTCSPIKFLSKEEVFIRNGEYKGHRATYIKFQSEKLYKVSLEERAWSVIEALAKTIFSLGFALFSEETRESWATAWYGRKPVIAYIANTELSDEKTLTVKQIAIKAISFNGRLQDIPKDLQDDDVVVLAGISYGDSRTLQYAPSQLRANERIVIAAVEKHGNALQYASEELRRNKDIALKAIRNFAPSIEYISSERLRNDPDVVAAFDESKKRSEKINNQLSDILWSKNKVFG